jgi:redox-sensing transcriptional repressor
MNSSIQPVPYPTIKRYPAYLQVLKELKISGMTTVSARDIADRLGLNQVQVRKDLGYSAIIGRPKVGYDIDDLTEALHLLLGWQNPKEAFLIGAGALGSALLGYRGFQEYGLDIVAAFDNDPAKHGSRIHGKTVFPLERVAELAKRMGILIGVLTVPEASAQSCADRLIEAGIRGIWNFSPIKIQVPENIVVQREELSSGLAVLSVRLSEMLKYEPPKPHQ